MLEVSTLPVLCFMLYFLRICAHHTKASKCIECRNCAVCESQQIQSYTLAVPLQIANQFTVATILVRHCFGVLGKDNGGIVVKVNQKKAKQQAFTCALATTCHNAELLHSISTRFVVCHVFCQLQAGKKLSEARLHSGMETHCQGQ